MTLTLDLENQYRVYPLPMENICGKFDVSMMVALFSMLFTRILCLKMPKCTVTLTLTSMLFTRIRTYTQTQTHGRTTELQGDNKSFGPKQQSCDNYTCTEICAEGKEIQVWIPNGHHKPGGQCHACFRLISRV